MLFNEWDFKSCPVQARKAVKLKLKKVNLVPTLHFIAKTSRKMEGYCFQSTSRRCEIANQIVLNKLNQYWQKCLPILMDNNIKIMITPHLDDGEGRGIWRNSLLFDPLQKYSHGLTYYQLMFEPIFKAIKKINKNHLEVEIAMQGEMGATLFYAPTSYLKIIRKIKANLPNAKVGISVNYNNIAGDFIGFAPSDLQDLIDLSDFIGLSAYAPVQLKNNKTTKSHFKNSILSFIAEWKILGINLPKRKPYVFSEVGLGGGNWLNDGKTPGTSIEEVAGAPYAGLYGHDINPWENQELFSYRRDFYQKLNRFLNNQIWQREYKVIDAYIWNANTWDIMGFYPKTEPYQDKFIYKKIIDRRRY